MPFDKLIEKAKETTETFSSKMLELKDNFLDEEKQTIIQDFKEKGEEKITQILDDLDHSKELLKSAGYNFSAFDIALGIPPAITISFELLGAVEKDKQELILKETENAFTKIILKALMRATHAAQSFQWGDFKCTQVNISLGLLPDIQLQFKRKS